jgi:lipopolysaccharide biosynthesis glycosyltransferase
MHRHTAPPAACFRLLAGSSLPAEVAKVIYLDADLLIGRDIAVLWEQSMQGMIVLAVQDSYIQRLPAGRDRAGAPAQGPRPYFNSGVMVIDLQAWRMAGIERRCLDEGSRLPGRLKWLDQHVLNTCLAGRWGKLPPVWNRQFSLDLFPDWRCSPYDEAEFHEARNGAAIIHFCTRTKPWHPYCDHPRQDVLAYRAALRGTPLGGDAQARPAPLQRSVEFFAAPHRRLLDTIAAALRANRRSHALQAMLPDMLRLAVLNPWTLVTVPLAVVRERIALWTAA